VKIVENLQYPNTKSNSGPVKDLLWNIY